MSLFEPPPNPGQPDRLELEAGRVTQRLRTIAIRRLGERMPDGRSRARAAFDTAQLLVELRAELLIQSPRTLPELPEHAAADVFAVVAADILEDLRNGPDEQINARAVDAVVALRRTL